MGKYLDNTGLEHLWGKIKNYADGLFSGKVDRTGDTMTGDLVIQKENSYLKLKSTSNKTSIGTAIPSSNQVLGGEHVFDADNRQCYYSELVKSSSDTVYRSFCVKRYTSNGSSSYVNGFYLTLSATGEPVITFSNAAAKEAWKTALGIGTREAVTLSANKTLASSSISTLTNIISVSLEAGTWIVVGQISFPGGSGTTQTTRRISISNTATGSNYGMTSIPVVNNAGVAIQVCATVDLNSTTTIYLNASQNSGSSMTITSGVLQRITAVRVA